jgi:hypothetical protein
MFAVFCADWDYPSYRINGERRKQGKNVQTAADKMR